ncbi:MAG TPA: 6-phosphogluconolactonase [Bryobacteraceae bacterium]|jgi:glucosamine-6-phosphate deaminase|nr:6-phosphogluconolactonase [Bryobacteraceae bacterium]
MLDPLFEVSVEELRARARIGIHLEPDIPRLLDHFARSIADEIRSREVARLILPVGPMGQYPRLAEMTNRERISWRHVHVFQMDEFLDWQGRPIPAGHPLSFEGAMRRFFASLDSELRIPESQYHAPHPFRIDDISEAIRRAGGIDVCYGGVGYHGHVAFNEPPLSRWARITVDELRNSLTRVVTLGSDSIVVQSIGSAGGSAAAIPPMAVTLGMRDILASRKIRLYCAGGSRHSAVFRIAAAGEVGVEYPATLVQGHPDAVIHTDEATAQPIRLGL